MTALAHPGTIEIGLGHGVFVLSEEPKTLSQTIKCKKFLHKPSLETMHKEGAILQNRNFQVIFFKLFPFFIPFFFQLFVDSAYFFSRKVAELLLEVQHFKISRKFHENSEISSLVLKIR